MLQSCGESDCLPHIIIRSFKHLLTHSHVVKRQDPNLMHQPPTQNNLIFLAKIVSYCVVLWKSERKRFQEKRKCCHSHIKRQCKNGTA